MDRFFRENIGGMIIVGIVVGVLSAWVYDRYIKDSSEAMKPTPGQEQIVPTAARIIPV